MGQSKIFSGKLGHCKSDLICPNITCNSLEQLLGSRSTQPLLVADIASMQTMYSLSTHKTITTEDEPIGCHFLNDNTAAAILIYSKKINYP